MADLMSAGSGNTTRLFRRLPDVRSSGESKMVALTGSRNDITFISDCKHDINRHPTAIQMFSGSGNVTRLLRRLRNVYITRISGITEMKDGGP